MLNQFLRVLIVEENQRTADKLSRILSGWGYHVLKAASERSAVRAALAESIDLVLMNWSSQTSLQRFARKLRDKSRYPLIVGLVPEAKQNEALSSIRHLLFDYITKPIEKEEASVVLEDVFERRNEWAAQLSGRFKKYDTILKHMVEENFRRYKYHLLELVQNNEKRREWAGERLDMVYKAELGSVLGKIENGVIPKPNEISLVSRVEDEIENVDLNYLPQTARHLARIREGHSILRDEKYKQDLEQKRSEIEKMIRDSKGLTKKQFARLERDLKDVNDSIYFLGH